MAIQPSPPASNHRVPTARGRSETILAHKDTFFFAEYKTIAFFYHQGCPKQMPDEEGILCQPEATATMP